ncbi:hypothetical protein ACJMK2_019997 [Sinanodonta woodiana]|uniref:FLYWCH-type domain-containing protein n=1 Tax=Sinanodonta woodiana TaxID=1069815 RepID=A0ABD3U104_SINWO
MENLREYSTSKRGNRTLLYRGHDFCLHSELKNGSRVWRCTKNRTCKCKATVVARNLVIVGNKIPQHSHKGSISFGLVRRAVG